MRRFRLVNERNETKRLNGEAGIYLFNPTGLGVSFEPKFGDLKHGFYAVTSNDTVTQGNVVGDLLFDNSNGTSPYEKYRKFVDWLAKSKSLQLYYTPDYLGEYNLDDGFFTDVVIEHITKTEKASDTQHELLCPISFKLLAPWHATTRYELEEDYAPSGEETIVIPLYATETVDGESVSRYMVTGQLPATWQLQLAKQDITNPVFEVVGVDSGTVYCRMAMTGTIYSNEILEIYTDYLHPFAVKRLNPIYGIEGPDIDLINYIDVSSDAFFKIPIDEECEVRITATWGARDGAYLEIQKWQVFNYWWTV